MKNIKLERTQSLLKELIPTALANLNDTRLNALNVIEVKCSRGKYSAQVFLDCSSLDKQEQKEILNQLKKAKNLIKEYCLEETGWFRCPDFQFFFDESLEIENKLDKIFRTIEQEKQKRNIDAN